MSQQEIPIAAAVFGTSSNENIIFVDQELEQRIANTTNEIEEKSIKIVKMEKEINALKVSLTPIFGVVFMRRIEENPIWAAVNSREFESQFLHHEIPAVVNIAALVKRVHTLKEECKELTQRLEQLRGSQNYNNYSPTELFRFIEDLRKETVSQRIEIVTLREETVTLRNEVLAQRAETTAIRTQTEEKIRKEVERVVAETMKTEREVLRQEIQSCRKEMETEAASRMVPDPEVAAAEFLFDSLSAPGLTAVTAGEAASVTVAYSSPYFADNYAISSIPLHRSRPSQWQVEVIHPGSSSGMVLGIIGKRKPASSFSYRDASSFGWCSGNSMVVAGSYQVGRVSWPGWEAGDKGIFTYSPSNASLSLRLVRGGGVREFSIGNCRMPDGAFIYCHFYKNGTALRFTRAA